MRSAAATARQKNRRMARRDRKLPGRTFERGTKAKGGAEVRAELLDKASDGSMAARNRKDVVPPRFPVCKMRRTREIATKKRGE